MRSVVGCHGGGRASERYKARDAVVAARGMVAASMEGVNWLPVARMEEDRYCLLSKGGLGIFRKSPTARARRR